MAQRDFFSALKKSEFIITNQVFFQKIERSRNYLSQKLTQDENYTLLLQELDALATEATSYQIRVTIVGRQTGFIEKVKLANQGCELLNPVAQFTAITFPCSLDRLLRNCDVVFLVIDTSKNRSIPLERNLVNKSQVANITLIIIDFNKSPKKIESWLGNTNLSNVSYFNFAQQLGEESQSPLFNQQYSNFLKPLLTQVIRRIEVTLEEKLAGTIDKYFMRCKAKYWEEIKQQKQIYLLGENHLRVEESVRQLPYKLNKIFNHEFKNIKQRFSESKHELINPFVSTSLIYDIQQVIREATVVESREQKTIYLNLVLIKEQHRQTIQSHILELYQQKIDLWIEQQWDFLEQEINLFSQLIAKSDRELQILDKLSETDINLHLVPKPVFDINKYICPTALSDINRTIFDYHYTQSSWFRLGIAIAVGCTLFLLTDRLFGFVFLVIQIINLLTGQSTKSLKLKQQTKELKKYVENKYHNLVKFIADKLVQDIHSFLDSEHQLYQEKINAYIQESHCNLMKIKQKIIFSQNKISELNKEQENLRQIIKN